MAMFARIKRYVNGFRESLTWHREHDPRAPRAGDLAPTFELGDAKGASTVRLSQYRDKRPVALLFGSFT